MHCHHTAKLYSTQVAVHKASPKDRKEESVLETWSNNMPQAYISSTSPLIHMLLF